MKLEARWPSLRQVVIAGFGIGLAVGALLYVVLPKRHAVEMAFVVDSDQPNAAAGAAALIGLVTAAGDRSFSPDFYAYLVSSDEVLYRVACRLDTGQDSVCDAGTFDRVKLSRSVGKLRKRISATVTRTTGVVSVRLISPTDSGAVDLGNALLATLDTYHRAIRRSRAAEEARVAQRLRDSLRAELASAEEAVRQFQESNRLVNAPRLNLEQQRLERRLDLVNQVYLSLARDAQQAELRRSRDTPVMTVLQRPALPAQRVSPGLILMMVAAGMLGAVVATLYVVAAPAWRKNVFRFPRAVESGAGTVLAD